MTDGVALHIKYKDRPWLREHSKLSQEWNAKYKQLKAEGREPPPPNHPSMKMKVDEVLDYVREARNTPEIWEIYLERARCVKEGIEFSEDQGHEEAGFLGMFKSYFLLKRGEVPNRRPLMTADVVLYRLADGTLSNIDGPEARQLLLDHPFAKYLRD